MSWANQTRSQIMLISPEYNIYTAKWKNNERSGEKKLGVFDPPKFQGSIIQDMGVKSISYPLTIYFDGLTHYSDANDFFESCQKEIGQWEVIHPTKGSLILQLVSFKELINPIDDGNFTAFETSWLQPANVERIVSPDESIIETLLQILNTIEDGITQLQQLRADLYSAIQSALDTINKISGLGNSILSQISATNVIINDTMNSIKSTLNTAKSNFQGNPSNKQNQIALGQSICDTITTPVDASTDFTSRYSAYSKFSNGIMSMSPSGSSPEDFNTVLVQEIGSTACLAAIAKIMVTSDFKTRTDIVVAMDNMTTIFNNVINTLESVQDQFKTEDIDLQYFSQSTAYASLQKLFMLTMRYLISQFFNMKSEKRFTLKSDRSPIEITVSEYGDMGVNDANYELFLLSNHLSEMNVLILPAGTEVVTYV